MGAASRKSARQPIAGYDKKFVLRVVQFRFGRSPEMICMASDLIAGSFNRYDIP